MENCVFPVEIFAKIASCDLYAMGKLARCCRGFAELDGNAAVIMKKFNKMSLCFIHRISTNYNFEYIHLGNWKIWIIRVDTAYGGRIVVYNTTNNTHYVYALKSRKYQGSSDNLIDEHGKRRLAAFISFNHFYYFVICDEFTLKVVFDSPFNPTPIDIKYSE
ncbi:hypothetical protein F-VV10_0084 [Faustovirus]|nr:hypothetical protein F-VV10_0084 [Faustovirus]